MMYAVTRSIPPSRTTAYVYLGIGATIISIALGLLLALLFTQGFVYWYFVFGLVIGTFMMLYGLVVLVKSCRARDDHPPQPPPPAEHVYYERPAGGIELGMYANDVHKPVAVAYGGGGGGVVAGSVYVQPTAPPPPPDYGAPQFQQPTAPEETDIPPEVARMQAEEAARLQSTTSVPLQYNVKPNDYDDFHP